MAVRRIFWGFCRNWFRIDPLHYLSSFWLRIRGDIRNRKTTSWVDWVGFGMFKRELGELATPRLGESGSQHCELGSRYSNFLKFSIDFPNFKRLNQPFKRSIWQKRSQGCHVLSPLIYYKVWKKLHLLAFLSTPRLGKSGSRFSITNISANSNPKSERLET